MFNNNIKLEQWLFLASMVHICMSSIDCDEAQIDKFSSEDEDKDVYYLEEVQNILVNNICLNPIIIKKKP